MSFVLVFVIIWINDAMIVEFFDDLNLAESYFLWKEYFCHWFPFQLTYCVCMYKCVSGDSVQTYSMLILLLMGEYNDLEDWCH